jgi:hypothetical protein
VVAAGQAHAVLLRRLERVVVAGVRVANHAGARIRREDALEALGSRRGGR